MGWTGRVHAAIRALRSLPGAPSPCRSAIRLRLLREQQFTVWLAPACLHMGNKADIVLGLQHPSLPRVPDVFVTLDLV